MESGIFKDLTIGENQTLTGLSTEMKEFLDSLLALGLGGLTFTLATKTANYTLVASDLSGNTLITNEGATGDIIITLPALTSGNKVAFLVAAPYYLKVTAHGTEKFSYGGTDGAAGGYVRSNTDGVSWSISAIDKWYLGPIVGPLKYDE